MWDKKSVYPKIETRFASKPDMNDVSVEAFIYQAFNQECDESAILRIKHYNPPYLIFQHLPVKEKVKNIEVNRMRKGYIIDTLKRLIFVKLLNWVEKYSKLTKVYFIEKTSRYHLLKK